MNDADNLQGLGVLFFSLGWYRFRGLDQE